MSKMKLVLDVVHDLRSLAESLASLAEAAAADDRQEPMPITPDATDSAIAPSAQLKGKKSALDELPDQPEGKKSASAAPGNPTTPPDQPEGKNPLPAAETPAPSNPAAEDGDDALKLDLVSLRAAVAQYTSPVNRPKIKAILTQFGVKKLTELKEEQYPAVLSEVVKACET